MELGQSISSNVINLNDEDRLKAHIAAVIVNNFTNHLVSSAYDFLKNNNVRMGLVSNGLGAGYGHDVLSKFGIDRYFEVKSFREDLTRPKPYPDPILQTLEEMSPKVTKDDLISIYRKALNQEIASLSVYLQVSANKPKLYGEKLIENEKEYKTQTKVF